MAQEAVAEFADFSKPRTLPAGRLNNCFEVWPGKARIIWPEAGLGAEIKADPVFSRYMLYAPEEDRTFLCLEPMSHTPNALAITGSAGLHLLAPGEALSGGFSITVFNHGGTQ